MLDQELVERCLSKVPGAWEAFVDRFGRLIFWSIERALGRCQFPYNQQDLEDLFQQVFLLLWEKKLRDAKGIQKLSTWLVIVTHRIVLDYVKAQRSIKRRVVAEQIDVEQLVSSVEDPSRSVERKEAGEILDELLNGFSAKEQAVLRLNLVEEKTHSEIAELLKLPIGSVSSLIKRVKEKWAQALREKGIYS